MSKITFLEAIRQLIQSKDHEQYQFHRGILTIDLGIDISSGEFHMAADFINQVCNELTGDQTLEQSLQYKGMSQKTETISMLVDLISKIDLKGNMGAARFVHACQHLLAIHTRTPEAFTAFVVPVLDEFIEQIDALTNATNVVQVIEIDANKIAGIIPRLKREDRKKAFEVTEQRSAEFINLVNDPTSSFSELNEAVASQIVTALSLIQLALTDAQPVAVDRSSLEPVVGATVSTEAKDMIDPPAETPAPSYISEFPFVINQIKVLKAGSKEYNAKIKFFSAYINLLNGHEVQDIYRDASKIVFNGDLETTVLVNKLLNIA
jgi:hypothetical protein